MVTINFYQKLARRLELYLLRQAKYKLPLKGYDLILLLPIAPDSWNGKKTLLVSAAALATVPRWDATYDILSSLRHGLNDEEYLSIYNVDLIESSAYVVQQVKRYTARWEDGEIEAPISLIGGVTNQTITAIKSTVLDKLELRQSYHITLTDMADTDLFSGVLTGLVSSFEDVTLSFETTTGLRECLYSTIASLQIGDRAVRLTTA